MTWHIIAVRSSQSVLGAARKPVNIDGEPVTWPTRVAAQVEADRLNKSLATTNVQYIVEEA